MYCIYSRSLASSSHIPTIIEENKLPFKVSPSNCSILSFNDVILRALVTIRRITYDYDALH